MRSRSAEVSIRAFEEAISRVGTAGKVTREAAKEVAEASAKTPQEEVIISETGKTGAKEKREDEGVQKKIEGRLEFLARMYAANKSKRAEEEDEEEKS